MEGNLAGRATGLGRWNCRASGTRILRLPRPEMRQRWIFKVSCTVVVTLFSAPVWAQQTNADAASEHKNPGDRVFRSEDRNYDLQPGVDPENRLFLPFTKHLAADQKHFWTLPAHTRKQDL